MSDVSEKRLYGLPHAEELYDSVADVWENEIEPDLDVNEAREWEIEEWTVRPAVDALPGADAILEWVVDYACDYGELTEGGCDDVGTASNHASVVAAAETLREAIAERMTYAMADKLVARRSLEIIDGEPNVDGEPLYRQSPQKEMT